MSYYLGIREDIVSDAYQVLHDRQVITEVRYQYGWALDTRDWELFASLFTDEVDVDLPAFDLPTGTMPRARLVKAFQGPFRRPREEMGTQQLYSNIVVDLNGDSASCRSCLLGHHHVAGMEGGEDVELRAVYIDQFARTSDGWKIRGTAIQVQSIVGNPAIFA